MLLVHVALLHGALVAFAPSACRSGRRGSVVRACAEPNDGAAEEDGSKTAEELLLSDQSGPMDQAALQQDLDSSWMTRPAATPEQIASHLPDWASAFMLDEAAQETYEAELETKKARAFVAVEGRTWEELEGEEDGAGVASFTAAEIADDYSLPLETVFTKMGQIGVDIETNSVDTPIKSYCSESQLNELLTFVQMADPIAARESLADLTLHEISEEGGGDSPLSADALVALCKEHDIPAVLGAETRLDRVDHDALVAFAEREAAFL